MIMPASLNMATLFPLCAMRPSLCAEPLMLPDIEEKASDCIHKNKRKLFAN